MPPLMEDRVSDANVGGDKYSPYIILLRVDLGCDNFRLAIV